MHDFQISLCHVFQFLKHLHIKIGSVTSALSLVSSHRLLACVCQSDIDAPCEARCLKRSEQRVGSHGTSI